MKVWGGLILSALLAGIEAFVPLPFTTSQGSSKAALGAKKGADICPFLEAPEDPSSVAEFAMG